MSPLATGHVGIFLACVALTLLTAGIAFLLQELEWRWRVFCDQGEREYAYLCQWYSSNASPVAAGHADRSETRCAHACEPPSAAGEGTYDGPPPRPADGFYGGYALAAMPPCEDAP